MQIAIGWNVAPEPRSVVRLTARFRSAVLRELLLNKTGNATGVWSRAPGAVREAVADMFGKNAAGRPLAGHSHSEFLSWWEDRVPTRLLIWRCARPFDADEQAAVLRAASRDVSWASAGPDADEWKVRLVPLDESVPPPRGFDGKTYSLWESLTPYVPPRHHLRGGKVRESESITRQIRRELALRGVNGARQVQVEEFGQPEWVSVHVPRRQLSGKFIGDKRGYSVRLRFADPVAGPLRLGHSSSFGLGLFKPATD